jgi:hypothetical protein
MYLGSTQLLLKDGVPRENLEIWKFPGHLWHGEDWLVTGTMEFYDFPETVGHGIINHPN